LRAEPRAAARAAEAPPARKAVLADVDSRIPVRLLTGPARSGKTSVIRHLMTNPDGRCRAAHVVADPRTFDGLARSARRPDQRTAILENGSVCFLMRDSDVIEALNSLHLRKLGLADVALDYEEVLVEVPIDTSPLVVIYQLQTDTRLALTFRFEAIAAVVDAAAARGYLGRESPDTQGIARADILILSKLDLLSVGDGEAVRADVAAINPFALALTARNGSTPTSLAMDWDPLDDPDSRRQGRGLAASGMVRLPPVAIEGRAKAAIRCYVNNPMNDPRSNMETALSPVRAAHVRLEGNADIFRVTAAVAKVAERSGANLYRLKCKTSVPTTEHPVVFQYVDGAFIPPAWGRPEDVRETRLTVVGRDFEPRDLMTDVAACLWDAEAIARGEYTPF